MQGRVLFDTQRLHRFCSGIHKSVDAAGSSPKNRSGPAPMMVNPIPFTKNVCPITEGLREKRHVQ